ncbi:hypothetical protein BGX27_002133 [Mortierella sp. AM989]|nr:hypothetical protein BGX27_002133 [Mortierella sp. AM989]
MKLSTAISALLIIGTAKVFAATESPNTVACTNYNPDHSVFILSAPGAVNPYPVCQGTEHCLTLTGTLKEPITAPASLSFTTKFFDRVVGGKKYDLCALLDAQGTPCPVPVTTTSLKVCVPIEPQYPANLYFKFDYRAQNGNGKLIFCETSSLKLANCTITA